MAQKVRIDITGQRFHRLTALSFTGKVSGGHAIWLCRCDCGKETEVRQNGLRSGNTKSCGCLQKEKASAVFFKHGQTNSKAYGAWRNMKTRCYCESSDDYKNYGERGITVCVGWLDNAAAFIRDMGEQPEGLTLERKDVNIGYHCGKCEECARNGWEPNCIWDTKANQNRNKRNSLKVAYKGETKTLTEWCHQLGKSSGAVWHRMQKMGMTFEEAITKPIEWSEKVIEMDGEEKTLTEWCEERSKDRNLIYDRIYRMGWDPEDAFSVEVGQYAPKQRLATKYSFRGEMMILSEICRALGKEQSYFHTMKGHGHSIQDLIDKLSAAQSENR